MQKVYINSFSCKRSSGKIARYGLLNDVILRTIQSVKIPGKKESLSLCRTDGKRPGGVTVIPWSKGKSLLWDVTVPDTFATSHVNDTSSKAGAAAHQKLLNMPISVNPTSSCRSQ